MGCLYRTSIALNRVSALVKRPRKCQEGQELKSAKSVAAQRLPFCCPDGTCSGLHLPASGSHKAPPRATEESGRCCLRQGQESPAQPLAFSDTQTSRHERALRLRGCHPKPFHTSMMLRHVGMPSMFVREASQKRCHARELETVCPHRSQPHPGKHGPSTQDTAVGLLLNEGQGDQLHSQKAGEVRFHTFSPAFRWLPWTPRRLEVLNLFHIPVL